MPPNGTRSWPGARVLSADCSTRPPHCSAGPRWPPDSPPLRPAGHREDEARGHHARVDPVARVRGSDGGVDIRPGRHCHRLRDRRGSLRRTGRSGHFRCRRPSRPQLRRLARRARFRHARERGPRRPDRAQHGCREQGGIRPGPASVRGRPETRIAAACGYVATEAAKEMPYLVGAFGARLRRRRRRGRDRPGRAPAGKPCPSAAVARCRARRPRLAALRPAYPPVRRVGRALPDRHPASRVPYEEAGARGGVGTGFDIGGGVRAERPAGARVCRHRAGLGYPAAVRPVRWPGASAGGGRSSPRAHREAAQS